MTTPPEPIPNWPALKNLGDLSTLRPTIVIDTREQTPLTMRRLPSVSGTLTSGDYSFLGGEEHFAIERKSIADLVACCIGENRERFERELRRLRGYQFARLLIVGCREAIRMHRYRSAVSPWAVLCTMNAFEARYNIPLVWEPLEDKAAEQIESWAYWFGREMVQDVNALLRAQTPEPSQPPAT